jgi:sulfite exporter TauE/SafE
MQHLLNIQHCVAWCGPASAAATALSTTHALAFRNDINPAANKGMPAFVHDTL